MNTDLNDALKQALCNDDLPARLEDLGEFAVDRVISDGALRELPLVGIIVGIAKTGLAFRDYCFMKKILQFFVEMGTMDALERSRLVVRLEADSAFGRRAGEHIIALIDRLDDAPKTKLVARAFAAYAREQVDLRQLRRILYAIERMLLSDLDAIQVKEGREGISVFRCETPEIQSFVSAGLLYVASGFGVGGVRRTETMTLMEKYVLCETRAAQ